MANRYSDLTPSAYTPLTLEEIAMVPAMKRKQHDAILAQQEALNAGLAKADPHAKHFDEALALKKGIEAKMDATAAELAQTGVNPDMIGKTMALNREVQNLMSPTGKLGQINAEKINIAKIDKEYDEAAVKNNWSPAETKYWKDKALKEYMEKPVYGDDGKLITYTAPMAAPTRIDYSKKMDEYASKAGMTTSEFARAAQTLDDDIGSGQKAILGESYGQKFGKNYKQLLNAYGAMKREMQDPTSDVYKSIQYERRNPAELLKTMAQQTDIYKKSAYSEESGKTISPFGGNKDDKEAPDPGGVIISNDSTLKSDALDKTDYTSALDQIKNYKAKGKLTAAENTKYQDLIELRREADAKLNSNKDYLALNNKFSKKQDEIQKLVDAHFVKKDGRLVRKEGQGGSFAEIKLNKLQNELNDISKKRSEIKDNAWKESSSIRHNYSYLPSTPKEESIWNLHNENVFNTMKGVNLGNVLDLTSISTTGGTRKDLNPKDTKQVQDLLQYGDPKSFKINNIKTYGDGRTPEVTVTFNTKEGAPEYDVAGSTDMDDEYGGSEKPVTVTFKLKKFSNAFDTGSAKGYKSLSGAIADFWKDKGGVNQVTGNFQGTEVSNAFIENEYAEVSNEELAKRATVDSDAREALMIRIAKNQANKRK